MDSSTPRATERCATSTVPPPSSPPPPPSLWRRLACWLYEGMLLFGVVFIAAYLFSSLSQTRHALDNRGLLQGFLFVVLGIYFTWFWSKGQTLAMKTWRIRVTDRHGAALTQSRALLRYLLSWLWFLPPLLLAWAAGLSGASAAALLALWVPTYALLSGLHPERQYLHDALAGTRLILDPPPSPPQQQRPVSPA